MGKRTGPERRTLEDRFKEKVGLPDENGCWPWLAAKTDGYGVIGKGGHAGGNTRAHTVSYELAYGPLPEGLVIDHLCRNRGCVNPAHLEAVTHAENSRRSPIMGRKRQTHCQRGHELTPENTMVKKATPSKGEQRKCQICWRAYMRRQRSGERAVEDTSEYHKRGDVELLQLLVELYPREAEAALLRLSVNTE